KMDTGMSSGRVRPEPSLPPSMCHSPGNQPRPASLFQNPTPGRCIGGARRVAPGTELSICGLIPGAALLRRDREPSALAETQHLDLDHAADPLPRERSDEVVGPGDRHAVEPDDKVAAHEPPGCGAGRPRAPPPP